MRKLKTLTFVIGLLATDPCSAQSARTNAGPSQRAKSDSSVVMSSRPGIDLQESDVNAPKLEVPLCGNE
jgi:hypothetical protein